MFKVLMFVLNILKLFIVLWVLFLLSQVASAIDCDKHPIYCRIVELRTNISSAKAMRLSNLIHKYSKRQGTDPMISVAILMQEHGFRMRDRCSNFVVDGEILRGCTDLGIAQIHVDTAVAYNLDITKLSQDMEYNVKAHFRILADKIRRCKHLGEEAWTCYHSVTEVHRLRYLRDVSRYLR